MSDPLREVVERTSADWMALYKNKNFKGLLELYTEDCHLFPPGRPVANGREECARVIEKISKDGVARFQLTNLDIESSDGDMMAERSKYDLYDDQDKVIGHGKYLVLWKRVSGKWFFHYVVYNSDEPVKGPSPYDLIIGSHKKWQQYFNKKDFKAMSELYTPDCKVLVPGKPVCVGKEAVVKLLEGFYESGVAHIDLEVVQATNMGKGLICSRSTFQIFDKDNRKLDFGKHVVIWKQLEDEEWYRHFLSVNSDLHSEIHV